MAARMRGREERELPEAPPLVDAYSGMLILSLAATLVGLVFVWMDYSDYSTKPPAIQNIRAPAAAPPGQ